jgi:hypothetical protein
MAKELRTERITFRASKVERTLIEEVAQAAHAAPATWIRQTVLAKALAARVARQQREFRK